MSQSPKLKLKSGGQWLVSSMNENHIFCRETFSDHHKDVDKLVNDFSREKIYPNIFKIDKFNEKISKGLLTEMGDLGLLGVDAPEEIPTLIFPLGKKLFLSSKSDPSGL